MEAGFVTIVYPPDRALAYRVSTATGHGVALKHRTQIDRAPEKPKPNLEPAWSKG
jgi:hypothetical protein